MAVLVTTQFTIDALSSSLVVLAMVQCSFASPVVLYLEGWCGGKREDWRA